MVILQWVPASCFYYLFFACVEQSLEQNLSNKTRNSTLSLNVLNMLQIIHFFFEQNLSNKTWNSTLSLNVLNMLQII